MQDFPKFFLSAKAVRLARGGAVLAQGLNVRLRNAELLVVFGANGSGKTTALRALAGLAAPEAGRIALNGARCHYVGHRLGLTAALSVRAHLRFWRGTRTDKHAEDALAARVGLEKFLPRRADTLSAGERRRLALARLLAHPRALWCLDEPFGDLDAAGVTLWQNALRAHRAHGGAVVMAAQRARPQATHRWRLGAA